MCLGFPATRHQTTIDHIDSGRSKFDFIRHNNYYNVNERDLDNIENINKSLFKWVKIERIYRIRFYVVVVYN